MLTKKQKLYISKYNRVIYMAKSSMIKIEADKDKILQEIINNSRESFHNIAKKLDFSRQKVWKYLKELEKEGKIWGYTTVADPSAKNKMLFFALIKQKIPYLENVDQIIKNIREDNSLKVGVNLIGLYYANGPYDCICIFEAETIKDAKKYLGYLMNEYKKLIVNIDLVESVFPMVHYGKINPKIEDLKEFSIKV